MERGFVRAVAAPRPSLMVFLHCVSLLLCGATGQTQKGIRNMRANLRHDAFTPAVVTSAETKKKWPKPPTTVINPSTVVADASQFYASDPNSISAFSLETGELLWNVTGFGGQQVYAPMMCTGWDLVYALMPQEDSGAIVPAVIAAYEGPSGNLLWTAPTGGNIPRENTGGPGPVCVDSEDGDRVYVAVPTDSGTQVSTYDAMTGAVIWSAEIDVTGDTTLAVDAKTSVGYLAFPCGEIVAMMTFDGYVPWNFSRNCSSGGSGYQYAMLTADVVLTLDDNSNTFVVAAGNGSLQAHLPFTALASNEGIVFGYAPGNSIVAFSLAANISLWTFHWPGGGFYPPILVGDVMFVVDAYFLVALNSTSGQLLSNVTVGCYYLVRGSPVLAVPTPGTTPAKLLVPTGCGMYAYALPGVKVLD